MVFNGNKASVMFAYVVLSYNFNNNEQMRTEHLCWRKREGNLHLTDSVVLLKLCTDVNAS